MQAAHGRRGLRAVHHDGQPDGRRRDGQDVDLVLAERRERARRHAGRRLHARAHEAHLRDVLVHVVVAGVDVG